MTLDGFIFIEFLVLNNKTTKIYCNLADYPNRIQLDKKKYLLRGAVTCTNSSSVEDNGHFVAYCKRHNGKWETYNDLEDNKSPCTANKMVDVCALIYSIE